MSTSSKFVWHDLMTKNVDAAKKFYSELLGWTFKRGEGGDPYEHITAAGKHIGGMMKLEQPGVPAHWLGYVSVDDVDVAVTSIQKNGGKIHMPKIDIAKVGQFAVAADPQGGVFAPFHYTGTDANQPETNDKPAPYTFCWDELLAKDADAAARFYKAVFGWEQHKLDMGGFGSYTLLKRPGVKDETGVDKNAAGIMTSPPDAPHPPFWLAYIAVPNADAMADKLTTLGGKVLNKPMDIPNVGRFFPAMDPEGAAIAFLAPNT
jgi:predicted enzyme related to lactoylglutathione lyase